jgi:hypothetical protein
MIPNLLPMKVMTDDDATFLERRRMMVMEMMQMLQLPLPLLSDFSILKLIG